MKKIFENKIFQMLLAFIIPISTISLYIILTGHKFSDLLIGDAYQQYIHLFDYFKDTLNGKHSILWSFSRGMGGNMLGAYFYYLSSPLNLLVYFISKKNMASFIPILSIIKIGLSGLTMYYYLDKRTKNNYIINLTLAVSYALSSYNIVYLFCTMWLDVVYLAPLVILGIDKMIAKEKDANIFYIVFLCLSIFSNYYIAYMLCIFCVIYFIFRMYTNEELEKKEKKKITINFFLCSLLCGFIMAFELLPVASEMKYFYRDNISAYTKDLFTYFKNFIFSINLLPIDTSNFYYIPCTFCGYLIPYILIIFLTSTNQKNYRNSVLIVLLIFFVSMIFSKIFYIWHGFSYPVLYNHREIFLFNLFIIIIIAERFNDITILSKNTSVCIVFVYVITSFVSLILNPLIYNALIFLISIFFIFSIIYITKLLINNKNELYYITILILTILQFIVFLKFNLIYLQRDITSETIQKDEYFINNRLKLNNFLGENIENEQLIRINGEFKSFLETIDTKYSNINFFLSNNNKYVSELLKKNGYNVYGNTIYGDSDNIVMNNILGIKYFYEYDDNNKIKISNDDNSLEIGYMIDKNSDIVYNDNPFENQNNLLENMTKLKVFDKIDIVKNMKKLNDIDLSNSDESYIYVKNKSLKETTDIKINSQKYSYFSIMKIENNNYAMNIEVDDPENIDKIYIYSLNKENYNKAISYLKQNQIYDKKLDKNKMQFKINTGDKKTLLLTIPYDKGYKIYVDGKKTDYYKLFDAFIGIDLKKGSHDVKIEYIPEGLKEGIIISISTLLVLITYLVVKMCKKTTNI